MYRKKQSTEDYLESILEAQKKHGSIRAVDLARFMNFSKTSVSIALKKLKEAGYVITDPKSGVIALTGEGLSLAEKTLEKHKLLTKIFIYLGIDPVEAEESACKIEHLLSDDAYA
ncbi:MAG: metal-dependent transcriptional regulator, partial [Erysipelotrichia bacterium]|nr:metal-dependent transcriptional regulator [Erysipelotrichia bacterium]